MTKAKGSRQSSIGEPDTGATTSKKESAFPTTPCSCVSGFGSSQTQGVRPNRFWGTLELGTQ